MSVASNNKGRAYEYICLKALFEEVSALRPVKIVDNSSLHAARRAWDAVDSDTRATLLISARAAVATLFDLEPLITESGDDCLELYIQPDSQGELGDVRDIVITRSDIRWEIGLSIKHNHFAVKHSRLAKGLDFGEKWFGVPCSPEYWADVKPVFDYLTLEKEKRSKWSELPDKESAVYIPLLKAFTAEIKRSCSQYRDIPQRLVEYLLGEFDFYKVISIDKRRITQLQACNLRGALNRSGKKRSPGILIPKICLPTRIVCIDLKPGSDNTVEMYLDGGWQFSFRIHNATTYVESSLKFDIQIIGVPATMITLSCAWSQ